MKLNGSPVTADALKALALTNFGHFTSMLVEQGRVRGLSLHLGRLARDARQLFDVDLDTDRVRAYVRDALESSPERVVVRVTCFDPELDLGRIGNDASPQILITTRPASGAPAPPMHLQAVAYQRDLPAVKHVGLFGALKQRRDAQRQGFDDVLFVNRDGTISEIATSNIGFVRGSQVVWPRSPYLAGITMTLLNQELDEPVIAEPLTPSDLVEMDAAFATNAATGVRAVSGVDETRWPVDHLVLSKLRELYEGIPGEKV